VPTIGVSLAIPEPWATELQAYRMSIGDATAALIPTHITLVPPLDVEEWELPEIIAGLEKAAAATDAFDVHLRGTGTFRPVSPVVFVSVVEGISSCEQLAAAVRRGRLDTELSFPYHPHVTIAHHLPDPVLDRAFEELAHYECRFDVLGFHLYEHDNGSGWRPTHDFALRTGAG
jgi:2'-5' RNA ligase